MTVVVLLGAPGAGKGTQAPILAACLKAPILASGELLRSVVASGSELGRQVQATMLSGELVDDDTIVRIFLDRLRGPDTPKGAILDGFPRTRGQAVALDEALAEHGARVDCAILIHVPLDELVTRMAGRLICQASGHVYNLQSNPPQQSDRCDIDGSPLVHRADDGEVTVRARMAQQMPPLEEVVEYYRSRGVLATIDGRLPIPEVTTQLLTAVDVPAASNQPR
ncbi:MAG TPA: nucleoside monophosphate kinase [Candidatus Limnocylindrales bacterium]|nr:nucleoside monophosphate kinase [Candidatus Limnocylindrales bacterium]